MYELPEKLLYTFTIVLFSGFGILITDNNQTNLYKDNEMAEITELLDSLKNHTNNAVRGAGRSLEKKMESIDTQLMDSIDRSMRELTSLQEKINSEGYDANTSYLPNITQDTANVRSLVNKREDMQGSIVSITRLVGKLES